MSALDDARAQVERLERQEALERQLVEAGQAHEANPSQETLAEHNRVSEELAAVRAEARPAGGHRVGGDAYIVNGDGQDAADTVDAPVTVEE